MTRATATGDTEMSGKCLVISSCIGFLSLTVYIALYLVSQHVLISIRNPTLTLPSTPATDDAERVQCYLSETTSQTKGFKSPLLKSVIRAMATEENHILSSVRGITVYLNLTNACQPLDDVSKVSARVNKFALVTLANETECPLKRLALTAQNAGYAILIRFNGVNNASFTSKLTNLPTTVPISKEKVLIPVVYSKFCLNWSSDSESSRVGENEYSFMLSEADSAYAEIKVPPPYLNVLKQIKSYLDYLCLWFLVGPLMYFVEWMRRSEFKFQWLRCGGRDLDKHQRSGNETAARESENPNKEVGEQSQTEPQHLQSGTNDETTSGNEEQPLVINVVRDVFTRHQWGIASILNHIRKGFCQAAVCLCYLILITAALPVGISTGGLSFFRFDQSDDERYLKNVYYRKFSIFVALWWSTFQVFCFFMYSWFVCKATWTVSSNYPKVIRSDWFSSNVYLLLLAIIVPYSQAYVTQPSPAFYFAANNVLCTVCNALFIMILNKHASVTRYTLFFSICMICAYVESDIVAVYYYALNSKGSLVDINLTALRTAAIGFTLKVSLSSSMHIIRKILKPQESLFEGLSEK